MRAVPRLCEFYRGICLTTEEKHGKTTVRVRQTLVKLIKTSVRIECTYYQDTHTLQNRHNHTHYKTHTHTHTHTLQNNIKRPQYKLKQTVQDLLK
jgi:hypothetical protein